MKRIKMLDKIKTTHLSITVSIFMISILIYACTGTRNKDTSIIKNATDQITSADKSGTNNTNDDQKIECRTDAKTGTRFKKKICATKAEWAIRDAKERELKDRFYRVINNPNPSDSE
jgi:hypothetical protein